MGKEIASFSGKKKHQVVIDFTLNQSIIEDKRCVDISTATVSTFFVFSDCVYVLFHHASLYVIC